MTQVKRRLTQRELEVLNRDLVKFFAVTCFILVVFGFMLGFYFGWQYA